MAGVWLRYVRSRDDKQLAGVGGPDTPGNRGICNPEEYLGGPNGQADSNIPNNNVVRPCGLIAWSNFNDTISLPAQYNLRVSLALLQSPMSWHAICWFCK